MDKRLYIVESPCYLADFPQYDEIKKHKIIDDFSFVIELDPIQVTWMFMKRSPESQIKVREYDE